MIGPARRYLIDKINITHMNCADIQMKHGMRAEKTGTEIARSVYGAVDTLVNTK